LYPGVEVVASRVVTDRNRITGGGVTTGIDFALTLIGQMGGPETAAALQLMAEYTHTPANLGSPDLAPPELVAAKRQQLDQMAPDLAEFFAAKAGTRVTTDSDAKQGCVRSSGSTSSPL
jgi:cyclohexyl-isocyanide hydratase